MSAQPQIPVVLIGCGAVAQQFYLPTLRALTASGELRVHTLVDPSEAARSPLLNVFPYAAQAETIKDASAPPNSLAIIASPPRFHATQTLECFQRNWHVLCEKPMAPTSAECEQMLAAARTANRLLAIGLYKRFFPSSQYLKSLFTAKPLGMLQSFTISEGGPFNWPAATPSFFNKAQTPGGVLLDIGVHVLDLLAWWLGEPKSMHYADDAMGGLETNARLTLGYSDGAEGRLHFSRDWATANEYRFTFERGVVVWKVNEANGITLQLTATPSSLQAQLQTPIGATREPLSQQETNPQSFIRQLQNVLGAIRGTASLLVPGEEGIRSMRLIESCYRQRTFLEHPWFSAAETKRAQQLSTPS